MTKKAQHEQVFLVTNPGMLNEIIKDMFRERDEILQERQPRQTRRKRRVERD